MLHHNEETHAMATSVYVLTSNASKAAWKPLKSPAGVSRIVSITAAENDVFAFFKGCMKNTSGRSNGRSVKLRRTI